MLLVVLGAGASYDSASSRYIFNKGDPGYRYMDHRPPLAAELFSDRASFVAVMAKYHQCHPIIPRLQSPPEESSVEQELQRLQHEARDYREGYPQLSAVRYYLQEMIWECTTLWKKEVQGITNHKVLLDDIRRWTKPGEKRVCFVTFNYDLMLEDAFEGIGIRFNDLDAYISNQDFLLIKLHGSVNWAREVKTHWPDIQRLDPPSIAQDLIQGSAGLQLSQNYILIDEYPPAPRKKLALFPALAIPVETKLDFECPSAHVDALKKFLPQVSKILMIGWRATEALFLEMLKQELRQRVLVMAVAGGKEESAQAMQNISSQGTSAQYCLSLGGFTDCILDRQIEEFLKL